METIKLLGIALGLASLAGINLYLTVFVTGFAIHFQWITLSPAYHQLDILAHPIVLILSGTLYFIEFFADKIPWVDSIWDSVHTVFRPIGATLLAIMVLGEAHPVFDVIVGILAMGMSLTTHSAKAGLRLIANSSPEPFSNVALSVTEDVGVLGGLSLLAWNSALSLVVFFGIFLLGIWFLPKMSRTVLVQSWLIFKKLQLPARLRTLNALPKKIPSDCDILLHRVHSNPLTIVFAVQAISGRSSGIPTNVKGWLVGTEERPEKLYFVARRFIGDVTQVIELDQANISDEPRFLYESMVIYHPKGSKKYRFIMDRGNREVMETLIETIKARMQSAETVVDNVPAAVH